MAGGSDGDRRRRAMAHVRIATLAHPSMDASRAAHEHGAVVSTCMHLPVGRAAHEHGARQLLLTQRATIEALAAACMQLANHTAAWPRTVPRGMHAPRARIIGCRRQRRVDALRERGPWRRARIPAQRGARSHADRRRAERRRAAARREHGGAVDSRAGGDKGGAAESRAICAADSTAAASRVRPSGAWRGRGAHAAAARTAVRRVARGHGTAEPAGASVAHLRQRDGLRRAVDEATRVPGRARAAVRRRARRRHRRPALTRRWS